MWINEVDVLIENLFHVGVLVGTGSVPIDTIDMLSAHEKLTTYLVEGTDK